MSVLIYHSCGLLVESLLKGVRDNKTALDAPEDSLLLEYKAHPAKTEPLVQ